MIRFLSFFFLLTTFALISMNCGESGVETLDSAVIEQNGKVFIRDQTGKLWDVTHARDQYGLGPSGFQFGLGPNAIRPILNPVMLSSGDEGYPSDGKPFRVIGADLNNDPRAYSIPALARAEVADETFGEAHVAVAY